MNPGPAREIRPKAGLPFSRATTDSASVRGGALAIFAAASAPLHWNCPRSGRSDRTTAPSAAGRPASTKAAETISVRLSVNEGIGVRRDP